MSSSSLIDLLFLLWRLQLRVQVRHENARAQQFMGRKAGEPQVLDVVLGVLQLHMACCLLCAIIGELVGFVWWAAPPLLPESHT